ncbi:MAG: ABC transporter permease subunit [Opitutaceae bacterium]
MRTLFTLLRHELRVLLISPSTYIAAFLFLVIMGFIFQDLLAEFIRTQTDTAPSTDFIRLFWLPAFFLVPLFTMKSIAEERRLGTIETLMTTAVNSVEIVLAKFLAAYFFYMALWGSTLSFQYVLYTFAKEPRLLDPGPIIGGYTFIAISGALFIALGILASALTRSQLVAGILGFALVFLTLVIGRYSIEITRHDEIKSALLDQIVDYVQVFQHSEDFTAGLIDSRPFVLYLTGTVLLLFFAVVAVETRSSRA